MRVLLLTALALGLFACSASNEAPQVSDDGTPKYVDYTGDELPRAVVPEGVPIDEIELPLTQEGADTGQSGIVYAAMLGGYYLMRVQLPEGRFNYEYSIADDTWSEEDSIHRQCGSTITQAWLMRVTGRDEFRVSTRRALDYLFSQTVEHDDGSLSLVNNMGATALLSIATTIYTLHSGDDEYADELDRLGQKLITYIDGETGGFRVTDSIYLSPGQLMMALEHVHAATGDDVYLDTLERSAQWVIANPDTHNHNQYFALWANEPLTYLQALRPDEAYATAVFTMADKIVARQHEPGEASNSDWDGGYAQSSETDRPSWSTCLNLEAVADAYRMAVLQDDEALQGKYGESAQWAAGYLMRLQLRQGETDKHPDPALLVGAVPFAFGGDKLRVDVTHHVANSILKTTEYLGLEAFPGARAAGELSP